MDSSTLLCNPACYNKSTPRHLTRTGWPRSTQNTTLIGGKIVFDNGKMSSYGIFTRYFICQIINYNILMPRYVNIYVIDGCKENGPYGPSTLILVFDEQNDHLD